MIKTEIRHLCFFNFFIVLYYNIKYYIIFLNNHFSFYKPKSVPSSSSPPATPTFLYVSLPSTPQSG